MANEDGGIPGIAIGVWLAGVVLLNAGVHGRSIKETLQLLIKGKPVTLSSAAGASAVGSAVADATAGQAALMAGSATGNAVAASALSYQGVPYKWGGADPRGWDCSGMVTWVLAHDHGIALPNNTHTRAIQFYVWSGATTIPRSACAPGDLVCWADHIGIAINGEQMVDAPTFGKATQIQKIWSVPAPVIRRPKAYGA